MDTAGNSPRIIAICRCAQGAGSTVTAARLCAKRSTGRKAHREKCIALATATTTTTTTTAAAVKDIARAGAEDEDKGDSSAGEEDDSDCGAAAGIFTEGRAEEK